MLYICITVARINCFTFSNENGILIYQLFIEPKGQFLIAKDQWKEDFLKQIKEEYKIDIIFHNKDFKLIGLPFYNEAIKKTEFDNKFNEIIGNT